jgi:hypothetical protein
MQRNPPKKMAPSGQEKGRMNVQAMLPSHLPEFPHLPELAPSSGSLPA